jgi:hypothetical protein
MSSRLSFPPSRYPYPAARSAVQLFIQLAISPFWADFVFSGRPPAYKTAALPIELGLRRLKVKERLLRQGWPRRRE